MALIGLVLVLLAVGSGCGQGGQSGGSAQSDTSVADPAGRGRYAVGHREQALTDPAGGEDLYTSVWYPAAESAVAEQASYDVEGFPVDPHGEVMAEPEIADGRFPLIVFSHGSGSTRIQSSFLTETLASHGFVVVAVDHPGDGLLDGLSGGFIDADVRNAQVSAVIDAVLAGEADGDVDLADHVDEERIGLTGHSYGGSTSIEVAGGSYGTDPDERIDAIAPLASGPPQISLEQLEALGTPVLLMHAENDVQVSGDTSSYLFDTVGTSDRYRVVIDDASHDSFSIICDVDEYLTDPSLPDQIRGLLTVLQASACTDDVVAADQAQAIINRYVVAFFGAHLAGVDGYEEYLQQSDGVEFADDSTPRSSDETDPGPDEDIRLDGEGNPVDEDPNVLDPERDPYADEIESEAPGAGEEDIG